MTSKFVQRLLPFDQAPAESRMESVRWQPSSEALAAVDRLEGWLRDPRTGKPATELGEQVILAVRNALVDGKNGYAHRAEDLLEMLKLRNGRGCGDDIPAAINAWEEEFQADIEDVLDCLHERIAGRVNGR